MNLLWQEWLNLWIVLASKILCTKDGCVDATNHVLEESYSTILTGDDSLPVPLVYVERVQVVELLVGTDGIHVGIDAISWLYLILSEGKALPLSQGVNHLSLGIAQVLNRETHWALYAIEVVVDAETLQYKERGCYTTEAKFCTQVLLEKLFYQFDTHFGLAHIQQRLVPFGFNQFAHYIYIFLFII